MLDYVYIFCVRRLGTYQIAQLYWCDGTGSSRPTTANGVCLFPTLYSLALCFVVVVFLGVSQKPIIKHLTTHHFQPITARVSLCSMSALSFYTEILTFHFLRWKTPNYPLKPFLMYQLCCKFFSNFRQKYS